MKLRIIAALFFFLFVAAGPARAGEDISRRFEIIDAHEHVGTKECVPGLLRAMAKVGVAKMVLLSSPKELLYGKGDKDGIFTDPEANNEELIAIERMHPGVFFGFATFAPDDVNMLEKLKGFIARGGTGLKLYNGHYDFYGRYKILLDAPHLMEVYAYCEKNRVPVIFHANSRLYWDELKHALDAHPKMVVNLPHFTMALITPSRMREIFDSYPNAYTDVSLGYHEWAYPSLEFISSRTGLFRKLIKKYKRRFLFGADMVLNRVSREDETYVYRMILGYRSFLERSRYTNILIEQFFTERGEPDIEEIRYLNGLNLDDDTLRHIYETNPRRFLGIGER